KRLLHRFASPAGFDYITAQHLEKEPGASASTVHFFPRDHVAGAHRPGVFAPAFSDPHASFGRLSEAEGIARKFKMSRWIIRPVIRAVAQIFIETIWLDHLPRIHLPVRVPDRFEITERA